MTTTAKKLTVLAVVAAAFALPAAAQAATITATTPFEADVPACGETIHLSGQLLTVVSVTLNAAGGATVATHFQPQGISGVDTQTGTKYVGTGLTRDLSVFTPNGTTTFTFINRFHLQGTAAAAESFDVSQTIHITMFVDGTVTAFVDNFSAICRPS